MEPIARGGNRTTPCSGPHGFDLAGVHAVDILGSLDLLEGRSSGLHPWGRGFESLIAHPPFDLSFRARTASRSTTAGGVWAISGQSSAPGPSFWAESRSPIRPAIRSPAPGIEAKYMFSVTLGRACPATSCTSLSEAPPASSSVQKVWRRPWTERWSRRWRFSRSVRCLEIHLIIVNEAHLRAVLAEFVRYYNDERPHRTLALETPTPAVRATAGRITSRSILGGLHHTYARAA
jgi:hypothetical protein